MKRHWNYLEAFFAYSTANYTAFVKNTHAEDQAISYRKQVCSYKESAHSNRMGMNFHYKKGRLSKI